LRVGYYVLTPAFLAISEHVAVYEAEGLRRGEEGRLVALFGPSPFAEGAVDPEAARRAAADAQRFVAYDGLLAAVLHLEEGAKRHLALLEELQATGRAERAPEAARHEIAHAVEGLRLAAHARKGGRP
jgi:hypothetical protein